MGANYQLSDEESDAEDILGGEEGFWTVFKLYFFLIDSVRIL